MKYRKVTIETFDLASLFRRTGLSYRAFEKETGISAALMNRAVKEKSVLSEKMFNKILEKVQRLLPENLQASFPCGCTMTMPHSHLVMNHGCPCEGGVGNKINTDVVSTQNLCRQ